MTNNGPLKLTKYLGLDSFLRKQLQSTFSKYTELPYIKKLKNFHEQYFRKFTIKSKNGQKWPKMAIFEGFYGIWVGI